MAPAAFATVIVTLSFAVSFGAAASQKLSAAPSGGFSPAAMSSISVNGSVMVRKRYWSRGLSSTSGFAVSPGVH